MPCYHLTTKYSHLGKWLTHRDIDILKHEQNMVNIRAGKTVVRTMITDNGFELIFDTEQDYLRLGAGNRMIYLARRISTLDGKVIKDRDSVTHTILPASI